MRWRSLAGCGDCKELAPDDYNEVCGIAGELLGEKTVEHWITRTFPVFVIDEMQDSKGGQLEIVQAISKSATCLGAADGFQDLDTFGENAAVDWAHQYAEVISLARIHRTSAVGLLLLRNHCVRDGRYRRKLMVLRSSRHTVTMTALEFYLEI